MRLIEKVSPNNRSSQIAQPRVITLLHKCVELKIQDCMIQRLHFYDLYMLIINIDIANIKQAIKRERQSKAQKSNAEVRDISGAEAVKFLKGGGMIG